jgi:hypothetical protein
MGDIQPFIALQPDQIGVESSGCRRRQRRFAHASLPFQKKGFAEAEREEQRYGEPVIGHVVVAG